MVLLEEPIKSLWTVKNYVNGEWVEPASVEYKYVVNPATLKKIARVPISRTSEINEAVDAAADAFLGWRKTPPLTRSRYFFKLKALLEDHFEEISRICTQEHGKVIDESRGEIRRGIENVEVATGIPSLMMGYNLEDISRDIDEYVIKQPLGVFACVAPYNFPFMVPLWYIPYAVATGNTYVLKPSPWTPLSQTKLIELVEEAGFPPGVINMVHGDAEAVDALLKNPKVEGISFVGSTQIGRDVIYKEAAARGKRVQAQCGAKNFQVIMPDASVDHTVNNLISSFYGNTGQRCLAGANLVLVGGDEAFNRKVMSAIKKATSSLTIGYGLDDAIQMGPLQSEARKRRILGYVDKGLAEGAKMTLDGRSFKIQGGYPENSFLGPSIFEGVGIDMTIAKEEIFGPVMSVLTAKNIGEAIEMVNSSAYGNASSIYTASGKDARRFQYEVESGNVGVNVGTAAPMAFFPFSGMKDSFFGDLHGQGMDAVDFFTMKKVVIQRW